MKTTLFLLTNFLVIAYWIVFTGSDNYVWFPNGNDLEALDAALTSIFFYKTFFWLLVSNLAVLSVFQLIMKKYKIAGKILILTILIYTFAGIYVNKQCAPLYYTIFINQSVGERYIQRPICEAGYYIGPVITKGIIDRNMNYRRYAISGLAKIKYIPATETLKLILFDTSEEDYFRAVAYVTLHRFDTEETQKILYDFRTQATNTCDKKVVQLADFWLRITPLMPGCTHI